MWKINVYRLCAYLYVTFQMYTFTRYIFNMVHSIEYIKRCWKMRNVTFIKHVHIGEICGEKNVYHVCPHYGGLPKCNIYLLHIQYVTFYRVHQKMLENEKCNIYQTCTYRGNM